MLSDSETNSLPPQLQELLEQELYADEKLLWCGQPTLTSMQGFLLNATGCAGFNAMLAFVVVMGFFVAKGTPLLGLFIAALIGTPFLLGALTFISAPFVERREIKNTVYAVTDQRAITFVKKSRSTKFVNYKPNEIHEVQRENSFFGGGTISFCKSKTVGRSQKRETFFFENVSIIPKVEQLLKDLAAKVPQEESLPLDRLDDLPILHFLGQVPREIPFWLRLYLRQHSEDSPHALWGFIIAAVFGLAFVIMGVCIPHSMGWAFILGGLPFTIIGIWMVRKAWYIDGPKMIRMLQHGTATKARHLVTKPTGRTSKEHVEMQIDFEYQVEGQQYKISATSYDISRLTDAPSKVVFYDPMEPQRAMLLDKFPRGIRFDELTGRFSTNPLNCLPAFLAAAFVCAEIAVIVALALGVDVLTSLVLFGL